jgi:hypothetical protein
MIVKYRRSHLLVWIFLAILLPILVVLSILKRPEVPSEETKPKVESLK